MRQGLNIGESSIPTGVLPEVIAWFGDDDPNRDNGHIIQYHEPPLPYETIRVVRLNSIYRIARSRSDFIHSRGNRNHILQEKNIELYTEIERLLEEIERLRAT